MTTPVGYDNFRLALCLLATLVAACAGNPKPVPSEPAPAISGPYRPPPPCRNADDCLEKGEAALAANASEARELLRLACDKGSAEGCLALGKAYAAGKAGAVDRDAARKVLSRICKGKDVACDASATTSVHSDTCIVDACAWLADLSGVDDSEHALHAERGCSTKGLKAPEDRAVRARACMDAASSQDAAKRVSAARESYRAACSLGVTEGCKQVLQNVARPDPGSATSSAGNLTMESLDTDGLILRNVSCETPGNPLIGILGGMTVGAGLAQRKAALTACSSSPYESRIRWTARDQRVVDITSEAPDPKLRSCVEKALLGAPSVAAVHCSATLVVGKSR